MWWNLWLSVFLIQTKLHEEETRSLNREILVLKNHLIDANITIHKLQEDNVCNTVNKLSFHYSVEFTNALILSWMLSSKTSGREWTWQKISSRFSLLNDFPVGLLESVHCAGGTTVFSVSERENQTRSDVKQYKILQQIETQLMCHNVMCLCVSLGFVQERL